MAAAAMTIHMVDTVDVSATAVAIELSWIACLTDRAAGGVIVTSV
jgi:hypothetical protein